MSTTNGTNGANPAAEKPLHVVAFGGQNIMKLKAVRLEFKDNVLVIGGKNGAGKSSTLNCLLFPLAGKDAVVDQPVRKGELKGEAWVDLGELMVKRTFGADGTSRLEVKSPDGASYPPPRRCSTSSSAPSPSTHMRSPA